MVSDRSDPVRNVLLVGFMGSGKSTVGRRLAERLSWAFEDFDAEVERRAGRTIAELFAERGEPAFRALEARVAEGLLERPRIVLASGGGWPARPGRMESLDRGTLSVWLRVEAETALARVRDDPTVRPLLDVPDPLAAARALIREREAWYGRATLHLDTERTSPDALTDAIVKAITGPAPAGAP
jgi:shikimate kinase